MSQVDAGGVFGAESITEDRPVFSQFVWYFQDRLPVLTSRFVLTLPAGWRAEGVLSNGTGVSPDIRGTTYTWEARDLPSIDEEPYAPPLFRR